MRDQFSTSRLRQIEEKYSTERGATEAERREAQRIVEGVVELESHRDTLLRACILMRRRLMEIANAQDLCWRDWPGAYGVDDAIASALGIDSDDIDDHLETEQPAPSTPSE